MPPLNKKINVSTTELKIRQRLWNVSLSKVISHPRCCSSFFLLLKLGCLKNAEQCEMLLFRVTKGGCLESLIYNQKKQAMNL